MRSKIPRLGLGLSSRRVSAVGWSAWALFASSIIVTTGAALVQRYSGLCGSEGTLHREWSFGLFPFAQVCTQTTISPGETALGLVQTAVVYLSVFIALAATAVLLARGDLRALPSVGKSLLIAQASGVVLALITCLVTRGTVIHAEPRTGIDLALVMNGGIAVSIAAALTAIVYAGKAVVDLGKATS